jgi:hypothetical protein
MAYNLLHSVAENPSQTNFILYVGKEHMLPVTQQVANFINNPD